MKYEKPEVAVLASAVEAITQKLPSKPPGGVVDHINPSRNLTNGAYEATNSRKGPDRCQYGAIRLLSLVNLHPQQVTRPQGSPKTGQ